MTTQGMGSRGASRWFDADTPDTLQKTPITAGLILGIFLFALESERLSALTHVGVRSAAPVLTGLVPLLLLVLGTLFVCVRPPRKPLAAAWPLGAGVACSLGLFGRYYLAPGALQGVWEALCTVSVPVLIYCWAQRVMPRGRTATTLGFGVGALTLGCLSILTIAFERTVALVLVVVLPLVGAGILLALVPSPAEDEPPERHRNWNALRAIAQGHPAVPGAPASEGVVSVVARSALKLVPFLCYAVIFGNVHFAWVDLQDGGAVNRWVQLGAATGSMACGLAALALARLRWGHALESMLHLLLAAFALVALWLSTFLTSGYAFAYLVLLNIAQKLMLLLMLLFGFPFARNGRECSSLWTAVYLSFFIGTQVSYLVGTLAPTAVDVTAAVALIVVFVADIADIVLLYGVNPAGGEGPAAATASGAMAGGTAARAAFTVAAGAGGARVEGAPVGAAGGRGGAGVADGASPAVPVAAETPGTASHETLAYRCHLIAAQYGLTRREEEILQLLMRGRSAARIAETLCISVATARTHQRNIYTKLGVHTQQDILDLFEEYPGEQG